MELFIVCVLQIILLLPQNYAFDTDFCNASLCIRYKNGGYHSDENIGCDASNTYSSDCPASASIQNMTNELQTLILNLHNNARNSIASGNFSNFEPAERMTTMLWSDVLAYLATLNCYRCYYGADECRNTDKYPHAGQNIIIHHSTQGYESDRDYITNVFNSWFAEYADTGMNIINSYHHSGGGVGHFTQIINEKAAAVGCALINWAGDDNHGNYAYSQYFVCNYAFTNFEGIPVYQVGPTASECQTGTNPYFPSLCSYKEYIPPVP